MSIIYKNLEINVDLYVFNHINMEHFLQRLFLSLLKIQTFGDLFHQIADIYRIRSYHSTS